MKTKNHIFWVIAIIIVNILTLPYAWHLLKVIFASGNILQQLAIFKWVAVGFVLFAILRRFMKGNLQLAETFSHEFTHLVVAGVLNRELYEMHVKRGEGVMVSAGRSNNLLLPVALAPYCLPVFTLLLLSFRWMLDFRGMWLFDVILGMTICFHFYCFKTQIGNHQTDINQRPLLLSYAYIVTTWLLILCLIIPAFFPNMNGHGVGEPLYNYGLFSAVWRLLQSWWSTLISILSLIF